MTPPRLRTRDPAQSPSAVAASARPECVGAEWTGNPCEWFAGSSGIMAQLATDRSVLRSNSALPGLPNRSLAEHFKLESAAEIDAALARLAASGEDGQIEASTLGEDGIRKWYLLQVHPVRREQKIVGYGVHGVDITERKREESRLRRSEAMLVDTQGVAHLGVWEWDITQTQAVWSPELYRIYGLDPKFYVPTYEHYLERVHPEDRQKVMDATNEAFHNHKPYSHDERIYRADGSLCYLHTWAFPILDDVGNLVRLAGVCQDITDRKLAELERDHANELALSSQRLALHRAQYDELTRLPNRSKFRDDVHALLAMDIPENQQLALVTVGLDHFGVVNHALGHKIGDSILNEIAMRLARALPAQTILARTGPDLFSWVITLPRGPEGTLTLTKTCEGVQKALSAPLELAHGITLMASIGCALYPDHAESAEQLLQASDTALHWTKEHGRRGMLKMYEPDMHKIDSGLLELNKDLHRALNQHQLELHYQPIVSLADNKLVGVEALARWRRADGSYLPPDQFIPVIEGGDLLRLFTDWTLTTVCRQMADWRRRKIPVPYLSFNLSASQMRLGHIEEDILDRIREYGVPGSSLVVEITEGTLLDSLDSTHALLSRLRQQGLSVAVDDYGVGYASPNYLRTLPVDILKIDGSFLKDVPQSHEATSLLNGIIEIGRSLQLKIVTECIETQEHAAYLNSRGVTGGQGFWFSHALTPSELEEWMGNRKILHAA